MGMQTIVVLAICAISVALLGVKGYRVFFPAKGKACGGDCCGGGGKEPAKKAAGTERIMMVRSDDLARRAAEIKRG